MVTSIPISVILAAMHGDDLALTVALVHYRSYIRSLSVRIFKDANGNEFSYVDEDMQHRLELRLIYGIVTGFRILPS